MTIPKHIGPQPDHGNGRRLHRTTFPDVRYSAPGPPDLEPVVIALDDPMRVSRDH
jgi:hypothetical protein